MKKSEFLQDVAHGVKMLKKHAFKTELIKLNLETFDQRRVSECIYGQMTGHCGSKRAKRLMDKSCIRVFNVSDKEGVDNLNGKSFTSIRKSINGDNKGHF